jgi:hypothetical protein
MFRIHIMYCFKFQLMCCYSRIVLLSNFKCFTVSSSNCLNSLPARERWVCRGTALIGRVNSSSSPFHLVSGRVKAVRADETPKETLVRRVLHGRDGRGQGLCLAHHIVILRSLPLWLLLWQLWTKHGIRAV